MSGRALESRTCVELVRRYLHERHMSVIFATSAVEPSDLRHLLIFAAIGGAAQSLERSALRQGVKGTSSFEICPAWLVAL